MGRSTIHTDDAPKAIGPYAQAVRVGNTIYTSGQVGINLATGNVDGRFVTDQTRQVLENLSAVLRAAGSSLNDVVKTTVYLIHMGDFAEMNSIYAEYFKTNLPARSTVAVSRLPKDALVEIEAIAVVNETNV